MSALQGVAWDRGETAGNYAAAYGGYELGEDGAVLAPTGVLSGEWAGESIPELLGGLVNLDNPDELETACDAYESAYAEGFIARAEWCLSDDDEPEPTNPYTA